MAVVCIIVTVTCILIQLVLKIFPMIVAYFSFWIKEWFKFWGKPQIYLIENRELTIEWFSFILKTKLQKKKKMKIKFYEQSIALFYLIRLYQTYHWCSVCLLDYATSNILVSYKRNPAQAREITL